MRTKISGRALEVLHVEDNSGDAVILSEVLKGAGFPVSLSRVKDGEEALLFLGRLSHHWKAPQPDVVLLDLELPKKGGLAILNSIKQNPDWKQVSVIIFTASASDKDMLWAQRFNADDYFVKPRTLAEFGPLVKQMRGYWLKTFRKLSAEPTP